MLRLRRARGRGSWVVLVARGRGSWDVPFYLWLVVPPNYTATVGYVAHTIQLKRPKTAPHPIMQAVRKLSSRRPLRRTQLAKHVLCWPCSAARAAKAPLWCSRVSDLSCILGG